MSVRYYCYLSDICVTTIVLFDYNRIILGLENSGNTERPHPQYKLTKLVQNGSGMMRHREGTTRKATDEITRSDSLRQSRAYVCNVLTDSNVATLTVQSGIN